MKNINWFALMVIVIWLISAIVCIFVKDSIPLLIAAVFSIIIGFGYHDYKTNI